MYGSTAFSRPHELLHLVEPSCRGFHRLLS
jgi:hypothetical protein